jgi:hypothetical protein
LQTLELVFGDDYRGLHRGGNSWAPHWPSLSGWHTPRWACGIWRCKYSFRPQRFFLRALPSFWVLTLSIRASFTSKSRLWFVCGALIPAALCVALEFAAYSAGAAHIALWIGEGPRLRHLRTLMAGALASGSLIALALAAQGVLGRFVETTFFYLPTLMPAYGIPLVRPGLPWSPGFGSWVAFFSDPTMFLYAFVTLALLVLAALLPRGSGAAARARAMLPILAWIVFAMVSVVERRHVRYPCSWFRWRRCCSCAGSGADLDEPSRARGGRRSSSPSRQEPWRA